MSTPQARKPEKKITMHLSGLNDIRFNTPAHGLSYAPLVATHPAPPKPSVADYTFEQYKAAGLNIDEQHSLIDEIRAELPIIDRDEVDDAILRSLAQQLELCIFPTCKMMHIDPTAVKRMMDDQFRKAYGLEAEADALEKMGLGRADEIAKTAAVADKITVDGEVTGIKDTMLKEKEAPAMNAGFRPPPNKKTKKTPLSGVQKEVKAYADGKKRGKRGCKLVMLKSEAASKMWEGLRGGRGI
ncbi:hypothetical protein EJ02DRAFT_456090 [Clathrospora elynae]|uniref:Uncharacterized protein n=1 Tax=Clathrospora elynae TaxID=706981 RepID=A0A6A5SL49_9PLEO|nr:hypothetical protein EJ02DRAFT_456090 [Clathrospora elynae]